MIAAGGEKSAEIAGRLGDGFINTAPEKKVIQAFEKAGGKGKPKYGQMSVCYDPSEAQARKTALEIWPTAGLSGELNQELPTPAHFKQATKLVTEDIIAENMTCGADVKKHREALQKYIDAGYDHIYIHQIGPNQEGFIQFYQQNILPEFGQAAVSASSAKTNAAGAKRSPSRKQPVS
jgi:coenzyme F420-dependent glucose-6-phosphate dehydrogenase